jgi:hypothetical protein
LWADFDCLWLLHLRRRYLLRLLLVTCILTVAAVVGLFVYAGIVCSWDRVMVLSLLLLFALNF